jgi:hypothetical protein
VRRAQDRDEGGRHGVHGAGTAINDHAAASRRCSPAARPLSEALTAAIHQRVAQRAARSLPAQPPLVGSLCERCQDGPVRTNVL